MFKPFPKERTDDLSALLSCSACATVAKGLFQQEHCKKLDKKFSCSLDRNFEYSKQTLLAAEFPRRSAHFSGVTATGSLAGKVSAKASSRRSSSLTCFICAWAPDVSRS